MAGYVSETFRSTAPRNYLQTGAPPRPITPSAEAAKAIPGISEESLAAMSRSRELAKARKQPDFTDWLLSGSKTQANQLTYLKAMSTPTLLGGAFKFGSLSTPTLLGR